MIKEVKKRMATQNLFEKYGIKEVADVTFYRIEKKEETYEAQRTITASSILRGALELRTVYPINEQGVGDEDGFDAYVFTDAEILTGTNYDCDDQRKVEVTVKFTYEDTDENTEQDSLSNTGTAIDGMRDIYSSDAFATAITKVALGVDPVDASEEFTNDELTALKRGRVIADDIEETTVAIAEDSIKLYSARDLDTGIQINPKTLVGVTVNGLDENTQSDVKIKSIPDSSNPTQAKVYFTLTARVIIVETPADLETGANSASGVPDGLHVFEDDVTYEGSHEFSYAQQICMLFAKRQNIISKTGVRYVFENADTIFGDITFNDQFASAPYSSDRVVVAGIVDKFNEGTYEIDEVNEVIGQLRDGLEAKAYDITYENYAELVVEDEMGYYNPAYLGYNFKRGIGGTSEITFFSNSNSKSYTEMYGATKFDVAIANAGMWSDGKHWSINDAIDALKQKKKILDASEPNGVKGINSIFGGYRVSSYEEGVTSPAPGASDADLIRYASNLYEYKIEDGNALATIKSLYDEDADINSKYTLEEVIAAVNEIGNTGEALGRDLRVDVKEGGLPSNRAIYVKVDGSVDTAAGAYIYLLHNKNAKKLSLDKEGIFEFNDKKGNKLYYQDKIFAGVEYLALVILGSKGLVFVVNRHGYKDTNKIAWMVNDNGYVTDSQAKTLVKNGLIHTTDFTVGDETFEATGAVKELKIRKTKKITNRYVPVLFLDTLKVSTIEQTAENVYATGGRGNSNLIGWDYGKEITLTLQDALFTPASMSAIFGSYEGSDFRNGVKDVKSIDRMEKVTAKRNFIVPAGNQNGTPTEANKTAQTVFYDPRTMDPYQDGTPIAEGEVFYKYTRSIAYENQSIGSMIEISADKFPGTYKIVGDTYVRSKETGEDQRFQFIIPQAKMTAEQTITLEADGDPTVFDMNMTVLRPDDGVMVKFVQYDVIENEEENDGSTMVKGTENLNLLDDAELFRVSADGADNEEFIGATEY